MISLAGFKYASVHFIDSLAAAYFFGSSVIHLITVYTRGPVVQHWPECESAICGRIVPAINIICICFFFSNFV